MGWFTVAVYAEEERDAELAARDVRFLSFLLC